METAVNILFLSDNFPPENNACATRVYERACYWVKWGHQVTVITCAPNFPRGKLYPGYKNKWYQVEEVDGIRVVRVKTFIAKNAGFFLRIIDFLSYMFMAVIAGLWQTKPDVVVATSPQLFAAVGGWLLACFKRVPFVFELSDLWPASIAAVGAMRRRYWLRKLERLELFLYRRARIIIALSPAFKQDLLTRGIAAEKIKVVINGVDSQRYHPEQTDPELAKHYQLTDCFVVGYIGTHGMAHALRNVMTAAEILRNEYPEQAANIRFMFVGDGAQRQDLIAEAKQRQLTNVIFIPAKKKNVITKYWGLCQVALVHLKDDPVFSSVIPSKIFEAMGMGLPILLAAPQGEASKIIAKEQVGVWVKPEDPKALVAAVLQLQEDQQLHKHYAECSLQAASRYSRETQAEQMLLALQSVLDKNVSVSVVKD